MSATNSTTNYNLPIFIASDSPKWLVDWNGAMNAIDSAINDAATAASGAAGDITTLQSDLQTLSGTVTTQGTSISTLTSSLLALTGTVNTITSLIGNGEPTTTDKTIIGAINELHSDIQQIVLSVDADDVSYNNTTSGLLATNVQSAIDELENEISSISPVTPDKDIKRVVVLSDSYGIGVGDTNPWTTILGTLLNLGSGNYFEYSENGSGFTVEGTSGNTLLELLQNHATDITNHDTITDIVVGAGLNDISTAAATVRSAIDTFVTYCKTNYPNAHIWFGFIGNDGSDAIVATLRVTKNNIRNAIIAYYDEFIKEGCSVIRGVEHICKNLRNLLSSDYRHPNQTGHDAISDFVYEFMKGKSPVYRAVVSQTFNGALANIQSSVTFDGDTTSIEFVIGTTAEAAAISNGTALLGSLVNPAISMVDVSGALYEAVDSGYSGGIASFQGYKIYSIAFGSSIPANGGVFLGTVTVPTIDLI